MLCTSMHPNRTEMLKVWKQTSFGSEGKRLASVGLRCRRCLYVGNSNCEWRARVHRPSNPVRFTVVARHSFIIVASPHNFTQRSAKHGRAQSVIDHWREQESESNNRGKS
mmetsp:Transcript_26955/g.54167  ORF Transcript_26955/g.54167 Transcript_26955/m.54167 type:complete len:110 (+) Transcript_26955:260-589(+)